MKKILFLMAWVVLLLACNERPHEEATPQADQNDTLVVRQSLSLDDYAVHLYKSCEYFYWLKGKDTLDIVISISVANPDSMLSINVQNRPTQTFVAAVDRLQAFLQIAQSDYDFSKLESICFKAPIYYPDLSRTLAKEYAAQFGSKVITFHKLDAFMMSSSLNKQLDALLAPYAKRVRFYGLEKFGLVERKDYRFYFKHNEDTRDYPEFCLDAMRLEVWLEDL